MLVKPRRATAILTMGVLTMVAGCQGSPQLGAGGSMVQGTAGGEPSTEFTAEITDFGGVSGMLGWGDGFASGGVGGHGRTAEGKLITAAFLDAYNKLVGQLGAEVIETAGTPPAPTGPSTLATGGHYTPDMLVNVRGGPGTDHPVVSSAGPGATLTATGDTDVGWWQVDNAGHLGWIQAERLRAR